MLIFLQISLLIWLIYSVLPRSVDLWKLMLSVFCVSDIQGRELYLLDVVD